jgi:hypothetical protein
MDNYAEGSSELATDYDVGDLTFSENKVRHDVCMSRAYELLRFLEDPLKNLTNAASTAVDNVFCKEIVFQLTPIDSGESKLIKQNDGGGFLTANGARGFNRGYRLTRNAAIRSEYYVNGG